MAFGIFAQEIPMMRSTWFMVAVLILTTGVGAQKVKVEYDRTADFGGYRTYSWAEPLPDVSPGLALTNLQLFERRLRTAVDEILKNKGYALVTGETAADLRLSYQIDLDLRQTTQSLNPGGPQTGTKFDPTWVVSRMEGTLYLDIRDMAAQKKIWQGVTTAVIDSKKQEDRIRNVTRKMFGNFPPGK
jgi:hypothetical protein